jgi:hypothetical protein
MFFRNVGSYKATRRNIPEDTILQDYSSWWSNIPEDTILQDSSSWWSVCLCKKTIFDCVELWVDEDFEIIAVEVKGKDF